MLSSEQVLLREMAASWTRDQAPLPALRAVVRDGRGYDPDLYAAMAEMGWTGILIPEAHGGADFGFRSFGLVAEELGRNLVASPLLSSAAIGASALRLGGDAAQQAAWLPGLASGEITAALALEEAPRHDPSAVALSAVREGEGWRLDGVKTPVLDGAAADLLIVAARTGSAPDGAPELTLFLVPGDAPGVSRAPLRRVDGREAAVVRFAGVSVDGSAVLGGLGQGEALIEALLDRGRILLAAEMLGAAEAAFATTVEYLKTRSQFGQPIGAFQALQHRAVHVLGELELTRSAVEAALEAVDDESPEVAQLASLAKALAGETFRLAAREMVQMHGGVGMTEEHDAGLYLKRAAVADATWGNAAWHRERYARLLGY